ncbi:unnamed protein product [Rotaria socialis]|uniref:Uncharacterized protein n=1 Tax=Rotaria socialis TaxID=392032 RepID=A0A820WE70_9BILA|nr:unnamed protein product [Rotaria socialis]
MPCISLLFRHYDIFYSLVNETSLAKYFQPENEKDKENITEFDTGYKVEKAINWYTRETGIYKILNKSLRTQNFYDIFPLEPYIKDLSYQLTDEHRLFIAQQKTSNLTFYRAQLISKVELNRLKTSLGELLSVISFLSTNTEREREKALEFAISRSPPNDQLTSALLEISVDLNSTTKPFAVASINYNKWETCAALSDAHYKVNKLNLALENLTKCVEHQSKTAYTLIGHPSVMTTYRAIEDIDMKNKTYAKALIFTLKLLDAQLERKQLGHISSLTSSYQKLDDVVLDDSILEEALELCFKLLDDALETKLLQDILIASIYKTNVL